MRHRHDLIRTLCRAWCRVEPVAPPEGVHPTPEEWARLEATATREAVGGLIYRALGVDPLGVTVPAEVRASLRQIALAQAAVASREEVVLGEVLDAMARRGIRPVLLRGLGLVAEIYRDPSLRPQVDHDLLVPAQASEDARQAVMSIGFHSSPGGGGPYLRGPSVIDLHTDGYDRERIPSRGRVIRAETFGVLHRAIPARVAGHEVRVPAREDRLPLLAVHVVKHSFDRLIRLVDIAECWRAAGFDPARLVERARSEGTADALFFSLTAARVLLGAEVSPSFLEQLAPVRRPAVERAFGRVLAGRPVPYFAERLLLSQLGGSLARLQALRELVWPEEIRRRNGERRRLERAGALPVRLAGLAVRAASGVVHTISSRSVFPR